MGDLMDQLAKRVPEGSHLSSALADVRDLGSIDLNSQEFFLKLSTAFLLEYIEQKKDPTTGQLDWSPSDVKFVNHTVLRTIRDFQETKLKADAVKTYDPTLVPKLMHFAMFAVVGLLMKHMGQPITQTLIDNIQDVMAGAVKKVFADTDIARLASDLGQAVEVPLLENAS